MATEAEKLKRVSFTMRPEYIRKLSVLAENNSGASLSHEIRRLIDEEWERKHRANRANS